jgi:hypothetical protein
MYHGQDSNRLYSEPSLLFRNSPTANPDNGGGDDADAQPGDTAIVAEVHDVLAATPDNSGDDNPDAPPGDTINIAEVCDVLSGRGGEMFCFDVSVSN